jgi:hypothetical protein
MAKVTITQEELIRGYRLTDGRGWTTYAQEEIPSLCLVNAAGKLALSDADANKAVWISLKNSNIEHGADGVAIGDVLFLADEGIFQVDTAGNVGAVLYCSEANPGYLESDAGETTVDQVVATYIQDLDDPDAATSTYIKLSIK